jgi:hypothetical protein
MYHSEPQEGQVALSTPGEGRKRSRQRGQRTSPILESFFCFAMIFLSYSHFQFKSITSTRFKALAVAIVAQLGPAYVPKCRPAPVAGQRQISPAPVPGPAADPAPGDWKSSKGDHPRLPYPFEQLPNGGATHCSRPTGKSLRPWCAHVCQMFREPGFCTIQPLTLTTTPAPVSPAAQPTKSPYPPPASTNSSIVSMINRWPVGPCGCPQMRDEP